MTDTTHKTEGRPCIFTRACRVTPFLTALAIAVLGYTFVFAGEAKASGGGVENKSVEWTFDGPFGTFDRSQLKRGYKVYQEVCSACHSMNLVSFRNLSQEGGPEFSEAEVKVIAGEFDIIDPNEFDEVGDPIERAGLPRDRFPAPFSNENAARASNGGALPPDFSVLAKARPDGVNYIYSLLTGYEDAPADVEMNAGMSYNAYFTGHQIGMAAPLSDEIVDYEDGTPMTLDQYSKDVAAFMYWAAEPKMEERKQIGFQVILYLLVLAGLLYMITRKLWAGLH
ncbi:MAG: cytochrome c1 [Rhodobiaceae bacterium]|nr:cytochrome c1 [Rhodobiaceae bacterium]